MHKMTNRETANSASFRELCEKHNVEPTKRQVSKWRLGKGRLARALGDLRRAAK